MNGILYVTVLSISCSYTRNVECAVEHPDDVPDTIQWWLPETQPPLWRIRTFALDHDIHSVSISGAVVQDALDFARTNTRKNFGDVILSEHEIAIAGLDDASLRGAFELEGLAPRYEVSGDDLVYWKPDDARYLSRSAPSFDAKDDDPPILLAD